MAWIVSHQSLERHPKIIILCQAMGWDLDTAIGKMHRFWWWCVDYAEDGDLSKFDEIHLSTSVGLSAEASKKFLESLCKAKFVDTRPYLRVHEWWDYFGPFLRVKYKHRQEKWQRIKDLYDVTKNPPKNRSKGSSKNPVYNNITKHNITKHNITYSEDTLVDVLKDLNAVLGTHYKTDPVAEDIAKLITTRLKEGHTLEDFKKVHRNKKASWGGDIKMQKFLRPQTLYTAKFSAYLNEVSSSGKFSGIEDWLKEKEEQPIKMEQQREMEKVV